MRWKCDNCGRPRPVRLLRSMRWPRSMRKSKHARKRQQQRAINDAQMRCALDWGMEFDLGSGEVAFYVGDKEVRRQHRRGRRIDWARSVMVILASDGTVKTVYKTRKPRAALGWRAR